MLSPFARRLLDTYRHFICEAMGANEAKHYKTPVTPEMRRSLGQICAEFGVLAEQLDMPRTLSTVTHIIEGLESITAEGYDARVLQIEENLSDDLEHIAFESVPRSRVKYYSRTFGLGGHPNPAINRHRKARH